MKLDAPAARRNREPIRAVLADVLPEAGAVLEVAAGTGQHAAWLSAAFPTLHWQPTDLAVERMASIDAWGAESGGPLLRPARPLDVSRENWWLDYEAPAGSRWVALVNINMIHISPWEATEGLMRGAGALLGGGGVLYLYGPYSEGGRFEAPSNAAFDRSLRARDPRWGVRDRQRVVAEAQRHGFELERTVAMPANNLSLVLRKPAA